MRTVEAVMSDPYLLILCAVGFFYAMFGLAIFRRATKPSCRNCLFWQACQERQLGIVGPPPKRCM